MTSQEIFDKIKSTELIVTYFSYPECNVCKVLRPKVEDYLVQYEKIDFLYIDTHQNPEVSGQYLVFAVPTIIIFLDGREVKRFSRHFSMADFEAEVQKMLAVLEE
jgi:thioredoxin-like negative regulator of GroEL